jgi:hypothetical protein
MKFATVALAFMAEMITLWLVIGALNAPGSTAVRHVCRRHSGVASVTRSNPILARFYVICRDGWEAQP